MILVLLACSDAAFNGQASDEAGNTQGEDTATAGLTDDSGQPAYWTLGASLEVDAGLPHASESSVTINLLAADSAVLCTAELPVTSAGSKPPPDDAIYAWWALSLEPSAHCDTDIEFVLLGIGDMNADVEAGIPSIGYDDTVASGLNGAYFGRDSKTQWAFGVAGLAPSFDPGAGDVEDVDGPPIPDGTWLVEPLYPFPI
jgi:hypothetical protein